MNENVNASVTVSDDYIRACNLAERALTDSRTSLMMAYRFMDVALWKMPFSSSHSPRPLATDGRTIAYDPLAVLKRYRESNTELIRDLLHSIIHCIFRQPFDRSHTNRRAWMLACDIVTEAIAMEMAAKRFPSALDEDRQTAISIIRRTSNTITPNKLYNIILQGLDTSAADAPYGINRSYIGKLETLFMRDEHAAWPAWAIVEPEGPTDDPLAQLAGIHASASTDTSSGEKVYKESTFVEEGAADATEGDDESMSKLADKLSALVENEDAHAPEDDEDPNSDTPIDKHLQDELDELNQEWTEVSKLIETDLMTYAQAWGDSAGHLMANLAVSNRNRIDYRDFLRRFCAVGEDMKINDDEFDYIFYTYGLQHYGNMPLVEPLEYQESFRVREFIIAIDTSGSCEGELVQKFLTTTYEMLCNSEGFGEKVNIHIIQCDAQIQSDVKIESLDEIEEYRKNLKVRGFGGTDFRPVFSYVDKLMFEGEFTNLKGLIYFTDGYGTFPTKQPPYDTAFVFIEDNGEARRVPPWAMRVVVDKEAIRTMR